MLDQFKSIPSYCILILSSATAIAVGIEWDISWHESIGRDAFLSPPHIVIYLGGILAGIISSIIVLQTTFGMDVELKQKSVKFWGFRSSLGGWVCIWGAIAMLTSAPFDDWWHNAYGLDVEIISPPHIVLAMGIFAVILGACILILTAKNQSPHNTMYDILYVYSASLILVQFSIVLTEYSFANKQHSYEFYLFASIPVA